MANNNRVSISIELLDRISSNLDRINSRMDNLQKEARAAQQQLSSLDGVSDKLKKSLASLGAALSLKEFVGKTVEVRGEMQQLQVAFETMLGSATKANDLMAQMVQTAATTPFGLEDVANGATQLLAYGTEAEKVNATLIKLGDIAAGLSMPLNDLVYLYGTTMAQGRLYTQDLNQFTGRGIPMIQELAKQFGVAESKVKELVEAGKVGFPEVEKVIDSLTGEGGKFGGLMEAQSRTITGQIANIEDAIDMMFNEIGQKSEGIINTSLTAVSYVIEHYERFGRILLSLVATYGAYRTALMVAAAASSFATLAETAHYGALLLAEKAQKALNASMLANPYVAIAMMVMGCVTAIMSMKTETERLQEATENYEAEKQRIIQQEEEHRRRIEELISVAQDEQLATSTRREALVQLVQQYPTIFAKYKTETEMLAKIRDIKNEIAVLDGKKSITNTGNELASVNKQIRALERLTEGWTDKDGTQHVSFLTPEEKAKLQDLRNRRAQLQQKQGKETANNFFSDLTGLTDGQIQALINQRTNLIARMKTQKKDYGTLAGAAQGPNGTFSRDELEGQLQLLRAQQNERKKPKKTGSEWGSDAKKKYEDALKAYNDFVTGSNEKLTEQQFEEQRKNLKSTLDQAKKDYDSTKAVTDKSSASDAKKTESEAQKRQTAREKLGKELVKLQQENDAAEIEAMQEGADKKRAQIELDYEKRIAELNKQQSEWEKENKKAGLATGSNGLTSEQTSALDTARQRAEQQRQKATDDLNREQLQAMRDYLKEYGSLEQQRLAIAEDYNQRIAKAQNEWERRSIEQERDKALEAFNFESLSMGIDWKALLSGVGSMAADMLQPMAEKLQAYTRTEGFAKADTQTQQRVTELLQELRTYIGTDQSATWQQLAADMQAFNKAVADYQQAVGAEKAARAGLAKAQGQLKNGEITREQYDALAAAANALGEKAAQSRETMERLGTTLNTTAEAVKNYVSPLTAALNKAKAWSGVSGMSDIQSSVAQADQLKGTLDSILPDMGDDMAKDLGTTISTGISKAATTISSSLGGMLSSPIGSIVGVIAQIPKLILNVANAVKSAVTGVLDSFTELISLDWISDLVNSILESVGNLVNAIFDLPENLFNVLSSIVVNGVGGLLNTVVGRIGNVLTFGLLSSKGPASWFDSSNAERINKSINKLTARNELLTTAIDNLTDELAKTSGIKAVENADQLKALQEEKEQNLLDIAHERARYHGQHRSWGYYWDKSGGFTDEEIADFSHQIGREWDGNIWDLSPDEMARLQANADMWQKIIDTGEGSYGQKVADRLADYAAEAGALADINSTLAESLTQTSFDSLKDDFISNLMDMDASAEDFADNFTEMLMQSVLNAKVADLLDDELSTFYDEWAERAKDGLDSEDIAYLQGRWSEITDKGLALRDEAAKVTGYDTSSSTSQSGNAGGFTTMTQDQGTKLEGLFTSGLQHWSSIDAKMDTVALQLTAAESQLSRIADNTGTSATTLATIYDEFRRMLRDGLKVK